LQILDYRAQNIQQSTSTNKIGITSEYACYFGISSSIPNLVAGDSHTAMDINHSSLLFIGQHALPQWFFFFRLPQRYIGESNIPHFSKSEADAQIRKHANFHVSDNVTIGQLMSNTKVLGCFPLEEANHDIWTYGRIVCLGDAIHKMAPNLGQGGNQATESAAVLTNCLWEMLDAVEGKKVERGELEKTLMRYQDLRQKRAKKFVDLSGMLTRNDALATLSHTLTFLYFEPLSGEMLAGEFSSRLLGFWQKL
jgi:FAD dependent monooxygenase